MFGFATSNGTRRGELSIDTGTDRADAVVQPEWSHDLDTWTSAGISVEEVGRTEDVVTWKATLEGEQPRAFFRISVRLENDMFPLSGPTSRD